MALWQIAHLRPWASYTAQYCSGDSEYVFINRDSQAVERVLARLARWCEAQRGPGFGAGRLVVMPSDRQSTQTRGLAIALTQQIPHFVRASQFFVRASQF